MQRVCFITTQDKVYFLDLASFFNACEKEGLLKRWCFTHHIGEGVIKPHYHVWLESEDGSAGRIGQFLSGEFLSMHNEKYVLKYTCCTFKGTLHPTLQSNFNVKAELKL